MTAMRMQASGGSDKGINCHVNLIPVNPIKERSFVRSTMTGCGEFQNKT